MKSIKITEQQARILKDLDKTKVLKVTKEQYNKILEVERLVEMDLSSPVTREFSKNLSSDARKDIENTKVPGISETYESFIYELYGMNEGGEKKYEKLTKLMEVSGLINNGRIVKEKFKGNKDIVREVITLALEQMGEGCNEYKAMEIMEEALDLSVDMPAEDLFKAKVEEYIKKAGLNSDKRVIYLYNNEEYKEAWLTLRKLSENIIKEEEPETPKGIVGLDILKYPPVSQLKVAMNDEPTEVRSINLPIIDKAGYSTISCKNQLSGFTNEFLRVSNKWTNGYIDNFIKYYDEEPIFVPAKGGKLDFDIVNPKFIKAINRYNDLAGSDGGITEEDEIDETTVAGSSAMGGSSGPFVGALGRTNVENHPNVADELKNSGTIYEQGIGGGEPNPSGEYDTPGFEDVDMKGDTKSGSGPTHKKTAIAGGEFVKIKDKCKKFPYCNQGTDGIAESYVSKRTKLDEALILKHDKENKRLVIFSDSSNPKTASGETYKSKNLLKKNGFKWDGTNWAIDDTEFNNIKGVMSQANKVEYLVDMITDLEELVGGSDMKNKGIVNAKLDQYIEDLANATDEKALSAEIRKYLTFFSKFHQYSFSNRILIYIQNPNATRVASYKTWKERGRQVNKGEKSIEILVPIFGKGQNPGKGVKPEKIDLTDLDALAKGDNRVRPVGYKSGRVFDISQTKSVSPEGDLPEQPKWFGDNEPSETAEELYKVLEVLIANMGITLNTADSKKGEKGFSSGDHINLSSDIEGATRVSTLVHELAHELMHWKESSMYYVGDEIRSDRAIVELQAESVSYVVLKHYDLPTTHHPTYLALWKANKDKIHNNVKVISNVSKFIIDEIDKLAKHMGLNVTNSENDSNPDETINEMIKTLG